MTPTTDEKISNNILTIKDVYKTLIMSQNVHVTIANGWARDQANSSQQNQYLCSSYSNRMFSTCRDSSQHAQHCAKHINVGSILSIQPVTISERAEVTNVISPVTSFMWGERDETLSTDDLNETYEKMVF